MTVTLPLHQESLPIDSLQLAPKKENLATCQNLKGKFRPFKLRQPLSLHNSRYFRETTGLLAENSDLKLWLQAMEQQAHLRDTLNEALKQELHRLKVATGEISKSNETFSAGMQNLAYNQSFFTLTQQRPIQHHQTLQLQPQFQQSQTGLSNHQMLNHPTSLLDAMQQDSLGGLQGLDINKVSSNLVKSESSAISITESSSTF